MAFPEQINPADPLSSALASGGPAEFQAIKQFICDIFGIAPNTNITGPAMSLATTGVPTLVTGALTTSDPTVALGVANKEYVDNSVAVSTAAALASAIHLQANTTVSTIPVTADWLMVTNPANGAITLVKAFSATCTVVGAQSGSVANKRDQTAAFGAGTHVHLYAIGGNSQTPATLASFTGPPTGPTLPGTYNSWAYLGTFYMDPSGNVQLMYLRGSKIFWNGGFQTAQVLLLAGNATSYTPLSLTGVIPGIASVGLFQMSMSVGTAAVATYNGLISFDGANQFAAIGVNGGNLQNVGFYTIEIPNAGTIYYLVTNSNAQLSIAVLGYTVPNGAT